MRRILSALLLIIILFKSTIAQNIYPKREFRGAWVATVANIDWPGSRNATSGQKISELVQIFDKLKEANINAVFFQVRTECDALYKSNFEPWSYWLTNEQGKEPEPYFDPLEFAISEAHSRGMELHAWFNPYRAVKDTGDYQIFYKHISQTNPDWILSFGNYKMLDPGNPAVQNYILNVIADVLTRYDVDGIHFDDYFYPYSPKVSNEDSITFSKFNRGFTNIDDWRRDNINSLMKRIYELIKSYKPYVKFGISPFGIVENKYAGTDGFNSYSIIYCDPLSWIKGKYIDYIIPQLYWEMDHPKAPYRKLLPWWASVVEDRHLYIGHFSSRFQAKNYLEKGFEIGEQIKMNRNNKNVLGSVFFSAKSIYQNQGGLLDSLKNKIYKYPALLPTMNWIDSIPPNKIRNLSFQKMSDKIILEWNEPEINSQGEKAYGYVVYRFVNKNEADLENPENILSILIPQKEKFVDKIDDKLQGEITYIITALDRHQNESEGESIRIVIK
ncbi:MAG: family 10 glycosylhydrolase [Ignavibacteria bacterium]